MTQIDPTTIRPKGMPHFGIQTYDLPRSRDWYCQLLNAWVVYEKPGFFTTLTFDDEHHRVALLALPGKGRRKFRANAEIAHVAFEIENMESLLLNWERLKDLGILPQLCMNHGATLSAYYYDPDGNQIELFVDAFPTKKECQDWFYGPAYQHNFGGGTPFDPEKMLADWRAGTPLAELIDYPVEIGMAVDIAAMMDDYAGSFDADAEDFAKVLQAELSTKS